MLCSQTRPRVPSCSSHVSLPCALEEEPHNKHLQSRHANHHQALNHTEVEDSPLRTSNRAEIPVLSRTEILLVPCDCRELARELEDRFFQRGCLFRGCALLRWDRCALFVLDLIVQRSMSAIVQQEKGNKGQRRKRTAISKSTNFSANVLIWLLKQNLYSPVSPAVKTKSPCRSFCPSMMIFSLGPITS